MFESVQVKETATTVQLETFLKEDFKTASQSGKNNVLCSK